MYHVLYVTHRLEVKTMADCCNKLREMLTDRNTNGKHKVKMTAKSYRRRFIHGFYMSLTMIKSIPTSK